MSEERAYRMYGEGRRIDRLMDGWMDNLSSKRQGHEIYKECVLCQ